MESKNKFYILKEVPETIQRSYVYNLETGEKEYTALSTKGITEKKFIEESDIIELIGTLGVSKIYIFKWDKLRNYLGYDVLLSTHVEYVNISFLNDKKTKFVAYSFENITTSGLLTDAITMNVGFEINPHYKKIEKRLKKESLQLFFRESLDGKINLFRKDYELLKNISLEDSLIFKVYRDGSVFASASFNKSDCKFDYFKKSVELKLTYNDKYTKLLDAYENTYDLIKLAPAITPITLTKRCICQIYIQGERIISSYAGGTYWETEVDEIIDDENLLKNKYCFRKGPNFTEIELSNFSLSNLNTFYETDSNSDCWNAVDTQGSIKFEKIYNAGQTPSGHWTGHGDILLMKDGVTSGMSYPGGPYPIGTVAYDTYRINIYSGKNATGTLLYQSDKLYGKDEVFKIAAGENLFRLTRVSGQSVTPASFSLGENAINYQLWARLLCDVDQAPDGTETYDLPYDDFATPRRNYKKCIGLLGFDLPNSVVKIVHGYETSEKPTSYGINDHGKYFVAPYTLSQQFYHPLARNSWANTSLWVELFEIASSPQVGYEAWCKRYYRKYLLKNSYHIADAIKAIVTEIDPTIRHEKTPEYSQFLYGHTGATADALGGCDIYITQKTNILKGEYDQAAQKAEIKLKEIMDMLRECFKCYWFIDEQNRLRIEHVSYFINGMSYSSDKNTQLDLTKREDKFNKKQVLYCQQEIEFNKTELASRYEFAWMDDATNAMGGNLYVDIKNKYIQKDKTEEINIAQFSSDIDYMLFLPDDFSNDGFALIMADSNKEVPIVRRSILEEKQYDRQNILDVQNWFASFNQLIQHYTTDMPGNNIKINNISGLDITGVKRCVKHEIEFPSCQVKVDVNNGLIKTELGNGYIEEMSVDIDTDMTKIELSYEPS